MRMLHAFAAVTVVLATVAASALGQSAKLAVGDKAPPMHVSQWINGPELTGFDPNKVYVVEFWATWCGPCKRAIPHLNELHQKLSGRGVTIIGVSNEKADVVVPFVQAKGSGMSYTVAIDDNNKTTAAWMEAAGQKGIPCSFIVGKDNRIAYIGHPMDDEFERILRAVASGRFDPASDKKGRPFIDAARRAANVKNFRDAARHYASAIEVDPKTFSWAGLERYKMHLLKERNPQAAAAYGLSFIETFAGDGIALGDFAVMIVSDSEITDRDFALAETAAAAMIATAGRTDPQILDRLATVQFHTGKVQEAVDTQLEAWMAASAADKSAFKLRLDTYRAALNRKAGEAKLER
jgi:thiol-disulfide isomerase/thioredoxin